VNKGSEERPDLVILDLNIPKRNGHQVLEFIRRYDTKINVIIYSGSKSPEDVKKGKMNKADNYLVKPMTAEEMEVVVNELRNTLVSIEALL
jgi:DNA-binding response OmpR family regulator